jgi:hypothetical protein
VERENAQLRAELGRLANRRPKLQFSFADGENRESLLFVKSKAESMEPRAWRPSDFGMGPSRQAWDHYVTKFAKWKSTAMLTAAFWVQLDNIGSAVATDIKIEMSFPKGIVACRLPDTPEPPDPLSHLHGIRSALDLRGEEDAKYGEKGDQLHFHIQKLVHHRTFASSLTFLRFRSVDQIRNFTSPYCITYVEAPEPIEGDLHFTVENWTQPKE